MNNLDNNTNETDVVAKCPVCSSGLIISTKESVASLSAEQIKCGYIRFNNSGNRDSAKYDLTVIRNNKEEILKGSGNYVGCRKTYQEPLFNFMIKPNEEFQVFATTPGSLVYKCNTILTFESGNPNIAIFDFNDGRPDNYKLGCTGLDKKDIEHSLSFKVNDVVKSFEDIPRKYHSTLDIDMSKIEYDGTFVKHIQSYTYCNGGRFFTDSTESKLIQIRLDNDKKLSFPTDVNHPGGTQAIGRNVLIPCENEKGNSGKVYVYDVDENANKIERAIKFNGNDTLNYKPASIGITDFKHTDGKDYYLLVVCRIGAGSNSDYYGYIAEYSNNKEFFEHEFTSAGEFQIESGNFGQENIHCQGFGLVTGTDNKVYMVALQSYNTVTTYQDKGFLFELDVSKIKEDEAKISAIRKSSKNRDGFTSSGGNNDGVHFRWGAGIDITPSGQLIIHATEKHVINSKLTVNHWHQ